jgi:tripartite-type tricarboxylate transporter receptor subunit TctC
MRVVNVMASALAACAAIVLAGAAYAQSPGYPDRPVKIIVPFAAGGPTDVVARLIGQKLLERFGQQFYVENLSGAGGNIGMAAAANGLFVNPGVPARSVKELVDLLKANPGKYTFASPGIGTTPHLSSELFKLTFGLDFALAPFPGGGPSIQSVVAGHVPISFQAIPPAISLVRDGKLRALAVTAKTRSPALPDAPTLEEAGIQGQEAETMQGVLVPAGTPKPIIDLLQSEITRIVQLPDVKPRLLAIGVEPSGMSSAEFAAYIKADIAKWKKVITDAKIPLIGG